MADAITPNDRVATVKIKDPNKKGDYIIINKSDFNDDEHELFDEKDPAALSVSGGGSRNGSGTFDEPTPTDIRYPNKNTTEFENNHGAYLGQSAAELRQGAGLDDKPGGLHPEVHEAVKDAEAATRAATDTAGKQGGSLVRKVVVDKVKPLDGDKSSSKKKSGKKKSKSKAKAKASDEADVDKKSE